MQFSLSLQRSVIIFVVSFAALWPYGVAGQSTASDNMSAGMLPGVAWSNGDTYGISNPAHSGISISRSIHVRLWGHEPFGLAAIREQSLIVASSFGSTGLAGSLSTQGYDALSLLTMSAAVSVGLTSNSGSRVRTGIKIRVRHASVGSIAPSSSDTRYGVRIGISAALSERFTIGSTFGGWGDLSEFDGGIGIQARVARSVSLLLEVNRTTGFSNDFRLGIDIGLVDSVRIRASMASDPAVLMFGILFNVGRLASTITINRHGLLGMSRAIGVSLSL